MLFCRLAAERDAVSARVVAGEERPHRSSSQPRKSPRERTEMDDDELEQYLAHLELTHHKVRLQQLRIATQLPPEASLLRPSNKATYCAFSPCLRCTQRVRARFLPLP